ncbi:DNA polymerase epsilon subunit 4-like [Musca domestica]|uniref:DNA polymerase epsilon subunit 4 n=1 Tax=Musca domestica TaxID=7370 RepID=A0A1I8M298_MUSDO|nr:DNA polymerase epsilon subunit 4 [Musca domestica]XP_058974842.1 DNA polymerase epsilon subunit 4-like [Musca domestica]
MASEDLFAEDFSEEIISELEQDYVQEADIVEQEDIGGKETEEDNVVEEESTTPDESVPVTTNTEEDQTQSSKTKTTNVSSEARLFQLPLTRVRNIMKLDPDLHIASNEAVFLVTRATELFIQSLGVESYTFTAQAKKKTVQKRDVDLAIAAVDSLMFLDGAMSF